jgi:hypothetical protein
MVVLCPLERVVRVGAETSLANFLGCITQLVAQVSLYTLMRRSVTGGVTETADAFTNIGEACGVVRGSFLVVSAELTQISCADRIAGQLGHTEGASGNETVDCSIACSSEVDGCVGAQLGAGLGNEV